MVADLCPPFARTNSPGRQPMAVHRENEKIHHFVHPSLCAYEKGVTPVLADVGADGLVAPLWNNFLGAEGCCERRPTPPDSTLRDCDWVSCTGARTIFGGIATDPHGI